MQTLVKQRNSGVVVPRLYGNFPTNGSAAFVCTGIAIGDTTSTFKLYGVDDIPSINEISGETELWRIGMRCRIAGDRGFHGNFPDLFWTGDQNQTGQTFPLDGSRVRVKMGNVTFPWNGTAPFIG